jgi:hypothetical protein
MNFQEAAVSNNNGNIASWDVEAEKKNIRWALLSVFVALK